MIENYNDPTFKKVDKTAFAILTSNGRNCRGCSKSNVCKYQEVVTREVERLIGELENKELPLSVDINCNEFAHKNTVKSRY